MCFVCSGLKGIAYILGLIANNKLDQSLEKSQDLFLQRSIISDFYLTKVQKITNYEGGSLWGAVGKAPYQCSNHVIILLIFKCSIACVDGYPVL